MIILFENFDPKRGDYVYTPNQGMLNAEIGDVLNNTVGQIIEIGSSNSYIIKYESDLTNSLIAKYRLFRYDENSFKVELGRNWIQYFSEDKYEVELYIATKKYNL